MFSLELAQLVCGNHIGHRAAGVFVRQKHGLARRKNGGGFRHKQNPAKDYYISICFRCADAKPQRVPRKIRDILNFRHLIIMGKDNGVSLLLEIFYFLNQLFVHNKPLQTPAISSRLYRRGRRAGSKQLPPAEPNRESRRFRR